MPKHVRYVTLAANGSLDRYPNNSLTKFTNHLAHQITPDKQPRHVFVKLRFLAVSQANWKVFHAKGKPALCHVHLDEVSPTLDGHKVTAETSKVLGTFNMTSKKPTGGSKSYQFVTFRHSALTPMKALPVHNLSILLTDQRGRQLKLNRGPATFVTLELVEMETSMGQMSITCTPKASAAYFPDNKFTSFTTKLQKTLQLDGYEVALSSVYFPQSAKHRRPIWFEIFVALMDDENKFFEFMNTYRWNYDLNDHEGIIQLAAAIQNDLSHAITLVAHHIAFTYREELGFFFQITDNDHLRVGIRVDPQFAAVFGDKPDNHGKWKTYAPFDRDGDIPSDFDRPLEIDNELEYTYIIKDRVKPAFKNYRMSYAGLLYCDIIEDTAIGDSEAGFMGFIPMTNNDLKSGLYEPQSLIFHDVKKFPFDRINFNILDVDGRKHDLSSASDDPDDIAVTLLLRPKQNKDTI